MDQIYPLAGTTTTSCASQDFDFLNYWVDQTVEKEILRGKKLRELKQRPSIRKEKYDVINIGHTNNYFKKKRLKRRNKSPAKSKKNRRRNSPQCKNSPTRIFPKKESQSGRHRCSLRIAELSVPSKRQCIDTWRTKYHVLPGVMIDRLRQHVLDLSPVVKIPDAIECFKRHKKTERRKKLKAKEKKMKKEINKCDNCNDKIKEKPTKVQECRYLCAIFGHKIAKQLNKPTQITLNTELQKISNVVSIEIEKLINKGKKIDSRSIKNKKVQAEVSGKIAIWISNILDETAYKILEDQLKDLEEEVGPVFDLIDDLVDNVVDVYEPEPEFVEVSSSSETYNIESSTDDEEHEETQDDDNPSVEISFPPESEPVEINLDDFIKNELDHIINSFDKDITSDVEDNNFTDDVENQTIQKTAEFQDLQDRIRLNSIEFAGDKEQNEFVDANDTFEVPLTEPDTQTDIDAETKDGNLNTDDERDADPDNDSVIDLLSEDDSNKKVKFSDVKNDGTTEKIISEQFHPDHRLHTILDQLSEPNYDLLSNADESWPEEITPPILRPSESVSKSITSLGNIMEVEERLSTMLEDDEITKPKIMNGATTDENINQLDENAETLKDSTININAQATIHDTINTNNEQLKDETGKDESEPNDEYIITVSEDGTAYTKYQENEKDGGEQHIEKYGIERQDIKKDSTELTEKYADEDGKTYTKEQLIEKYGIEHANKIIEKDKTYTYTGEDGKTYTQEQLIEKYGTIIANQIIGKDVRIIRKEINNLTADDDIHRPSTDSTFHHDIPTETVLYKQKLDKILEEQATQVSVPDKLEDEAIQVGLKDETIVTSKRVEIETADKEINTSFSLVPRADKSTSVVSQSLRDITKYLQGVKANDMFSSLRIKAKVDYKVHKNSAPFWVTQNFGEPRDFLYTTPQHQRKGSHDKNIRLWCKDLQNGFDNLELWNGWIENTVQSVKIMEMNKARICIDKSREEFVRDWLHLKKNMDADVLTWTKLSKSTQEKLKGFRKISQNLETTPPPDQNKISKCNNLCI